jgi:exodeoxyribonuclease-3
MAEALTVATWNVNSLRARLDAVCRWLGEHRPDVLCLQETKVTDDQFPHAALNDLGYRTAVLGQKTYNGVALLARHPIEQVRLGFDGSGAEEQKRLIAATVAGLRIVNAYIPNGSEVGSPKFAHKLEFLRKMAAYFAEYGPADPLLFVGDFNVAPTPDDVFSVAEMEGQVGFHPDERAALERLRGWGFSDAFRALHPEPGHYSWWDYRQASFRRNRGLRIDHVWAAPCLAARVATCWIDREERARERASDHAPVVATLSPA